MNQRKLYMIKLVFDKFCIYSKVFPNINVKWICTKPADANNNLTSTGNYKVIIYNPLMIVSILDFWAGGALSKAVL